MRDQSPARPPAGLSPSPDAPPPAITVLWNGRILVAAFLRADDATAYLAERQRAGQLLDTVVIPYRR